ncbi:MAG: hypothetical protein ABWX65_00075 [Mycetocola sp.]
MDRTGFDPRYSPEYQRGFDPAVHDGPTASPETHERIPASDERRRVRPTPVPPVPTVRPASSAGAELFGLADADGTAVDHEDEFAELLADEPVSPWRNPWVITLIVVGFVLLAGGISAFRWSVEQVYGTQFGYSGDGDENAAERFLSAQIAWGLSPLLALAGVLTLLGVAFFVAFRWVPRRSTVDDDEPVE